MKWSMICLILTTVIVMCLSGTQVPEPVTANTLLTDLLDAADHPTDESLRRVRRDTEKLNNPVLTSVAEHWLDVYTNPDFKLYMNGKDDPLDLNIPNPSKHAFVVLGFCLKDGEMEPELEGRCRAAAVLARAYPESIIICTGGATGSNNPQHNTEAGQMSVYLVRKCGIAPPRLYLDQQALTTGENATNSFAIMAENGIETYTVVTSSYHMRWGLVLFNATEAWYREQGRTIRMIGNWCYDIPPSPGYNELNTGIAISQLRTLLLSGKNPLLPDTE